MSTTSDESSKNATLDDLFPELARPKTSVTSQVPPSGERASSPGGAPALPPLGTGVRHSRPPAPPPPPPTAASLAELSRSKAPPAPPSVSRSAPAVSAPPPPPSKRSAPAMSAPPPPPSKRSAAPVIEAEPIEDDTPGLPNSSQHGPATKPPAPVRLEEPSASVMVADGVDAAAISAPAAAEQPITEPALKAAAPAAADHERKPIEPLDDEDEEFDATPTQMLAPSRGGSSALDALMSPSAAAKRSRPPPSALGSSVPPPPRSSIPTAPSLSRPPPPEPRPSAPPATASFPPAVLAPASAVSLVPAPPPSRRLATPLLAAAAAMLLVTAGLLIARPKALGFGGSGGTVVVSVAGQNGGEVSKPKILIDGALRCESAPCRVDNLPGGAHFVQVEAPGYETTASRAVEVTDGKDAVVHVELTAEKGAIAKADERAPRPAATAPDRPPSKADDTPVMTLTETAPKPAAPAEPRAGSGPARPAAPAPAPAADGVAHLNLNSIPIANVVLDGRPLGSTPVMGVKVKPGSHTVIFIGPDGARQVRGVNVAAGATQSVGVRF